MGGRQHIDLGKNQRDIAIGQGQLQASKADPEGAPPARHYQPKLGYSIGPASITQTLYLPHALRRFARMHTAKPTVTIK